MKNKCFYTVLLFASLLTSCATDIPIKTVRGEETQTEPTESPDEKALTPQTQTKSPTTDAVKTDRKVELALNQQDIQKLAYELGLDPKKLLTDTEKLMIQDRQHLRELERGLNSNNERLQYSKVLPWLRDDQEKIKLLDIPTIEGRQVWINKNKIWSRSKSLVEFDEAVEAQDIALGMPTEYVKKAWGEPLHIEISGNPIYRNERWQFNREVATPQGYKLQKRLVYFEGGKVVGWETE